MKGTEPLRSVDWFYLTLHNGTAARSDSDRAVRISKPEQRAGMHRNDGGSKKNSENVHSNA